MRQRDARSGLRWPVRSVRRAVGWLDYLALAHPGLSEQDESPLHTGNLAPHRERFVCFCLLDEAPESGGLVGDEGVACKAPIHPQRASCYSS